MNAVLTIAAPNVRNATKRLRIGVLVSQGKRPQWMLNVLNEIREAGYVEMVLIRIPGPSGKRRGWGNWELPFEFWKSLDRSNFVGKNDAFFPVDINNEVSGLHTIVAKPASLEGSLSSFDLARINDARLDVILSLDQDDLIPHLREAAIHGAWAFARKGDEARGTSDDLLVQHVSDRTEILARRTIVAPSLWSLARHLNEVYWHRSKLVKRALLDISESGVAKVASVWSQSKPDPSVTCAHGQARSTLGDVRVSPGNLKTLVKWGRQLRQGVGRMAHRFFFTGQWFVGVRRKHPGESPFQLKGFRLLTARGDRFFADPFVVEEAGRNFLFFEEFPFATRKGVISCVEFDDSGFLGKPTVVLEAEYHLSYPFLFRCNGRTYLLPEMRSSGRVCLFRATDFPFRWELEQVLLEGVWGADPTLAEHDGRFWLFLSGGEKRGLVDSELFLYFSNSLFGPWTPHPRNPVVTDVTRARPAGQIFSHDGYLIRPGQDCSQTYGRAVVLNRIEELSLRDYRETPIQTLEPDWQPGNIGTHTFNQSQNYQTVDGRFFRYRLFGDSSLGPIWSRYSSLLSMRRP